ncbi:MAG TPA: ATP phosphoribosyltransferase [Armatimonadota bacterium]|nr:ATP phosphoribosyltransferase [Armatimonadota bacterium]
MSEVVLLKLKLGLPKGSLQEATFGLFRKAGFEFRSVARSYHPTCDDPEIEATLLRAQEIPRYVEAGVLDAGITGYDNIMECESDVHEIAELHYSKATALPYRWVLAVPNDSSISSPKDLHGKRIATELVNVTKRYLAQHGVSAEVEFSWGATEVKVPNLVDAIVEGTETGSTLKAHGLKIVDTILVSTTRFIANKSAWQDEWKQQKMENISMLIEAALTADGLVGLKMNVAQADLKSVINILPALKNPTLSPLSDGDWVAVEIIVEEKAVRDLIPKLRRAGATGIVEYPLNKVIF